MSALRSEHEELERELAEIKRLHRTTRHGLPRRRRQRRRRLAPRSEDRDRSIQPQDGAAVPRHRTQLRSRRRTFDQFQSPCRSFSTLSLCLLALPATVWADGSPKTDDGKEKIISKQRVVVVGADGNGAFWSGDGLPQRMKVEEQLGKGFLGVNLMDLTPELREHFGVDEKAGVMVSRVEADSPAAKAGVKAGDIITSIDGDEVSNTWDVSKSVRQKKEGELLDLEIYRDGKLEKMTATAVEKDRQVFEFGSLPRKMSRALSPQEAAAMDEAMQSVRQRVAAIGSDPGMRDRVMVLRSAREAELEKRLADLEKRLAELQKKIENRNR